MAKRILVTGGAGFVGRALVRKLLAAHEVCLLDAFRYAGGRERFTPAERARMMVAEADIRDGAAAAAAIAAFRPEAIVHLAAIHFIPECERDPGAAVATNVLGTVNLLAAAPEGCRFVFASSGAVYRPDDALHDEEASAIAPADVYGFTKLHGEHYVRYLAAARKLEAVIVRLFNVVGPGETNPHLVPELVAQLKAGRKTIRVGNTWPKRDYIHVEDAADGFFAAATRGDVAPGEAVTVNLGTSVQHSVDEILDKLIAAAGGGVTVEKDAARMRPVDRPFLGADIRRIGARFGWRPRRSLDDAILDLWKNPELAPDLAAKY